jgi:hypothetical protein
MDGACRAKFTIDVGITAFQAAFAHVNVVFRADITGLSVGMIHTGLQNKGLTFFFAKAFEIIADLNN